MSRVGEVWIKNWYFDKNIVEKTFADLVLVWMILLKGILKNRERLCRSY
jgi:hypothetical protein